MRAIHGRRTSKQAQEDTKNPFPPGQFVQGLESRTLFSASIIISPNIELEQSAAASSSVVTGYTPAQIRNAYGFSSVDFPSGSGTVAGLGQGQTIAIVDAYNDPNISSDLNVFDSKFGLSAPPSLKIVNQTGGTNLPASDAGWDGEISLDVEWAHAIAPDANILLVEANSDSLNDLMAAVNDARNAAGVSVVSMSWGGGEFYGESAYDSYFTTPAGHQGVTFVAAAGDSGSSFGPEWPAVSPNVIGVGGTSLTLASSSGTYGSESAWGDSTGGTSQLEPMPSYQSGIPSADTQSVSFNWFSGFSISSNRSAPDVAYDADPNTGFAVYDSVPYQGYSGWQEVGGTSAGAPQWGALIAIADQGRALKGLGSLNGSSQTLPALYRLASSSSYSSTFHDVTTGGSYFDPATTGYDQLTGLGSPRAAQVISALSGATSSSPTSTATVATARTFTRAVRRADLEHEVIATPGVQATPVSSAFVAHSPLQAWAGVEPAFALADTSPVTIIHSSHLTRFDALTGSLARLASESASSPLNLSESISQKIVRWPAVGLSGTGSIAHLARDVTGVLGSSIGVRLAGIFSGASAGDAVAPLVAELPATVLGLPPAMNVRDVGNDRRWESVAAAALGATLAGCWYLNAGRREKKEEARGLKARRVRGGWEMTPMEEKVRENVPEPIPMKNKSGAVIYYLFFASQKPVAADIVQSIFSKYRDRGA